MVGRQVLPSGLLLFAAEAPDLAGNRVFLLKLLLWLAVIACGRLLAYV